jgi:hypothetical protein
MQQTELTIIGKVTQALPKARGTARDGKEWLRADYVVTTPPPYPEEVFFSIFNSMAQQNDLTPGETVRIHFTVRSRAYFTQSGETRYGTELRVYKIDRMEQARPQQPQPFQQYQQPTDSGPLPWDAPRQGGFRPDIDGVVSAADMGRFNPDGR